MRCKHPFRAVRNNGGVGLFFYHSIRLLQSRCPDTHPVHRRCSRFCPQVGLPQQPEALPGASAFFLAVEGFNIHDGQIALAVFGQIDRLRCFSAKFGNFIVPSLHSSLCYLGNRPIWHPVSLQQLRVIPAGINHPCNRHALFCLGHPVELHIVLNEQLSILVL